MSIFRAAGLGMLRRSTNKGRVSFDKTAMFVYTRFIHCGVEQR